ncbi:Putative YALI0E05621p [Rhizopus microsporus]|nr:Putative YALI0E05621p [Rhizopus microsporus]
MKKTKNFASSVTSSINSPIPTNLEGECKKAAKILNSFIDPGEGLDKIIPASILEKAQGLAIYTVLKAGFLFSGRAGSGLVVARLPDGGWSAPSAIGTGGIGAGGQIGAELTDFVLVLNTKEAVKTFSQVGNVTLGGNVSVAAGPIGRNAEASGSASLKHIAAIYSYKNNGTLSRNQTFKSTNISAPGTLRSPPPLRQQQPVGYGAPMPPSYQSPPPMQQPPSYNPSYNNYSPNNYSNNNYGTDVKRAPPPPPPSRKPVVPSQPTARAIYAFEGQQDGDLSFQEGEIITIIQKSDSQDDWWTGKIGNRQGVFPANYVQLQ